MRLIEHERTGEGHSGEIYSCSYAPDGSFILSGGWDGHLRLWEATAGSSLLALRASPKPLSCCAFSPDGKLWLSGSMEGMLSFWDSVSHQQLMSFIAHTRPISGIRFAPDGKQLATTSWDRQVSLRKVEEQGAARSKGPARPCYDIVAGCRCHTPGRLASCSPGPMTAACVCGTPTPCSMAHTLSGHEDQRVTAADLSPDGRWAISGSRDGVVKLWDLVQGSEMVSLMQVTEIRACFFLLDGQSVITVDANGWLVLLSLPNLELQFELNSGLRVMCGDLSPAGTQIALGCENGLVQLVSVEGFEHAPLVVMATQCQGPSSTLLGPASSARPRRW